MRMKESALHPGVLDTYITCLMMACDTNDRGMIESMVKAMVSDYTPQPNTPPPLPISGPAVTIERNSLVKKIVSYRI